MVPLGLLGPLSADWFREHKVIGCPHPHVPSGELIFVNCENQPDNITEKELIISLLYSLMYDINNQLVVVNLNSQP